MRIDTLRVKNYRCFEEFEIKFSDSYIDAYDVKHSNNLHVLLAPNMVGKSALLKALRIAIGAPLQKIKANPAPIQSLNISSSEHRITGNNPFSDKAREVEITATGRFSRWNGESWENTEYSWKKYKEDYSGKNTKTEHIFGDISKDVNTAFNRVVEKSDGCNPLLVYLGTEYIHQQKAVTDTLNQNGLAKQGYWYCLDDKSMESYVFDWFRILFQTVIEQNRSELSKEFYQTFAEDTLDTFRLAVKQILPEITDVDWIVDTMSKGSQKSKPILVFKITGQGVRTYEMLSDGFRYLVLLIGELVTRATLLNKHIKTDVLRKISGVILIDEFGIHLHPNLQSDALKRLSALLPNVQFIITTHSPLLINGLHRNQLHLIDEDLNGHRISSHPEQDAIGIGAEGILQEMFGLDTTFDQISIAQNEEYKELLLKRERVTLNSEDEKRFKELGHILAPMRLDPTLVINEQDPITKMVRERLSKEPSRHMLKSDEDQSDLEDRVNSVLDNIFRVK